MADIASLLSLVNLTGLALVSKASDVVGVKDPTPEARKHLDVDPAALVARSEEWKEVAETIAEHQRTFDRNAARVMEAWGGEAAEGFHGYATQLLEVMRNQKEAAEKVSGVLDGVATALRDAELDTNEAWAVCIMALLGAALGCAGGVIAGNVWSAATAEIWVPALVASIIGALTSFLGTLVTISAKKKKLLLDLEKELDELIGLSSKGDLEEIGSPENPVIVTPSFDPEKFFLKNQQPSMVK